MELIRHDMPRDFTIFDLSDFHVGSPNCALETLQQTIDGIKRKKNAYIVFKGDAIECILPNDKRYTHTCVMDEYKSPKAQADKVIEMFKPIASKILAWGIGNHEYKLINTIDLGKYIADSLGAPYGAYVFKVAYYHGKELMFKTYHTHGWGSVNSNAKDDIQYDANRKAGLKHKLVKSGHGDCVYMSRGHDHQLIVVDPTVNNKMFLTDDGEGVHQQYHVASSQNAPFIPPDSRWYATTGSFRKLYSKPGLGSVDYSEMAGFAPSEIGYAKVHVKNGSIQMVEKVVA
jgi:hypothetical protein